MGDFVEEARYFQRLALVLLILTLVAFSTTYILPVLLGRFIGPPILHFHGVLFLAWPALFLAQAHSIRKSRRWHRWLGFAGISLATGMFILGLAAIGSSIGAWEERGVGLEGQAISIIAFSGILVFTAFFITAIARTHDRATHSRMMALATLAIMQASSGRLGFLIASGGNPDLLRPGLLPPVDPVLPMIPHLIFALAILGWMAWHDRKSLGRFHPATVWGGSIIVLVIATRHLVVETEAWRRMAGLLVGT